MCTAYRYKPLDPTKREIRLLSFESTSHRSADEQVRCKIEHVSLGLSVHFAYHAISYSWGKDPKQGVIILDSTEVLVPESAVAALKGTCKSPHNRATPVWIDAICINQHDLDEKADQVNFMGEIYSKADQVLIYLGDDDGSTTAAKNTLLRIAAEGLRMTNNGREMEAHLESKLEDYFPPYTLNPPPSGCNWIAFFDFLAEPWFSRLWVVQEVMLAQQATCFRGDIVLAWHTIKVAIRWLAHRLSFHPQMQYQILFNVKNTAGSMGWVNITWLCNFRGLNWPALPFHILLSAAGQRQATEPRDKIYGLLGLVGDSLRHSPDFKTLLQPDYRRPLKDLYTQAAWLALKTTGTLDLLAGPASILVKKPRRSGVFADFPSWVPTFETPASAKMSPTASRITQFRASHDLSPRFSRDSTNADILKVRGTVVDQVSAGHIAFTGGEQSENASRIVAGNIEYVVSLIASGCLPGSSETLRSVAATLVGGVYGDTSDADEATRLVPDFCAFALACLQTPSLWPRNPLRGMPKDRLGGIINQLQAQGVAAGGDKVAFENASISHSGSRAYIQTAGGRIGVVSPSTKVGDKICILHGANLPFILRKRGQYWRLIETAYVYGIMKGESILELQHSGQLEANTVVFDIC